MLEILVIAIAMLVMAKTPKRRRRMGRYIRGNVDEELTFGALGSRALVAAIFGETVNERTLVSSLVAKWSLDGLTLGENIGPFMVGVAHSDYTAAEVEAWIENTGSWNEGDLVQQEVGSRKIRQIGVFAAATIDLMAVTLNDGKSIKTKLNWILLQGQSLDLWVYNLGAAAVATTTPSIHCEGHANLWPR